FHMNFEIHHGGNSLNNVANLHVTMAIRNCEFFEVLLPAAAQKYGLREDIEVDARGLVHAPAGPGLGAAIDFELIERRKTAVPTEYMGKIQELRTQRAAVVAAAEKKAGDAYMAKAAAEPGAKKLDSGVIITTLTPGTGPSPKATDKVKVHYHGTLTDGTVFD